MCAAGVVVGGRAVTGVCWVVEEVGGVGAGVCLLALVAEKNGWLRGING